jgi:hypothetical protein
MRFIRLTEQRLPLGAFSDKDISTGDIIRFEVEVIVNEPSVDGLGGLVYSIKPIGFVPSVRTIHEDAVDTPIGQMPGM